MRTTLAAALVALSAIGCSDKSPVSYSAPVGISLPVAAKDIVSGAVSSEKNINTESGNPYGAFTSDARARLGGADPSHVAMTGVTLELFPSTSSGVAVLENVFSGPVTISFDAGSGAIPVAHVTAPAGAGPLALSTSFDSATLSAAERAAITGGQFKVVLEGATAGSFTSGDTADLKATFTFVAYE
jgi:hypothetical protein